MAASTGSDSDPTTGDRWVTRLLSCPVLIILRWLMTTYIWTGGSGLTLIQADNGAVFNVSWGQSVAAFCFDGSSMWVSDYKSNTVTKFSAQAGL